MEVRALPIWYRLIQLVLFFTAAFPVVSFLPLFIQKTMTRSQTFGGDVIDYDWKIRTLYGYVADYDYFRPEEKFYFYLAVNVALACLYAFIIAFGILLLAVFKTNRKMRSNF